MSLVAGLYLHLKHIFLQALKHSKVLTNHFSPFTDNQRAVEQGGPQGNNSHGGVNSSY